MHFHYDVIIIGAGAAGLFCAIEAGKRGRKVLVLDHQEKIGRKILISGGGRCNFTNRYVSPDHFISSNPDFCISALARYTPDDFIRLVESYHIPYHEKKLGQLFCDKSAKQIIGLLESECQKANVIVQNGCKVDSVGKNVGFLLNTSMGEYRCSSLVLATGGLSLPKIGATDFGYRIASQFGFSIIDPTPGLVPLVFQMEDLRKYQDLKGISVDCLVRCNHIEFRENILFTHGGLSGPAILQISNYWHPESKLSINLLPSINLFEYLLRLKKEGMKKELKTLLESLLPNRLVAIWCDSNISSKPINQYSDKELLDISNQFHQWIVIPGGTEGFSKAEVTRGGLNTNELSSKTMESLKVKGLYCVGEMLDVTGWLGGYNFQWAWSSGWAAGQYV